MSRLLVNLQFLIFMLVANLVNAYRTSNFDCGPYGFICEPNNKVRLCEGDNIIGPSFLCPPNTVCNEDSSDVCENTINYIDPGFNRAVRCQRNERIADPSVPGCKGYILCIPNKSRFQGIKFQCSGNTIFNGYTRTCSAPNKYKCPLTNSTKSGLELYNENRRIDDDQQNFKHREANNPKQKQKPIECRNYRFSVTQDSSPVKAAYFCPSRPVRGETAVRCTIFSNQFCITLERDSEDQFLYKSGMAYRKPRM